MATWDVKLIAIGNARGIRLPEALLKKYGWGDSLVLEETEQGVLHICDNERNKLSWKETYRAMAADNEDWSDLNATDRRWSGLMSGFPGRNAICSTE